MPGLPGLSLKASELESICTLMPYHTPWRPLPTHFMMEVASNANFLAIIGSGIGALIHMESDRARPLPPSLSGLLAGSMATNAGKRAIGLLLPPRENGSEWTARPNNEISVVFNVDLRASESGCLKK